MVTRKHSSRTRTFRCSSHLLEGVSGWRVSVQRVSAWEGGVYPRGVCLPGGGLPRGCLPNLSGGGACQTRPLWTEFLTHACENITFPQLRLQMVKMLCEVK